MRTTKRKVLEAEELELGADCPIRSARRRWVQMGQGEVREMPGGGSEPFGAS